MRFRLLTAPRLHLRQAHRQLSRLQPRQQQNAPHSRLPQSRLHV